MKDNDQKSELPKSDSQNLKQIQNNENQFEQLSQVQANLQFLYEVIPERSGESKQILQNDNNQMNLLQNKMNINNKYHSNSSTRHTKNNSSDLIQLLQSHQDDKYFPIANKERENQHESTQLTTIISSKKQKINCQMIQNSFKTIINSKDFINQEYQNNNKVKKKQILYKYPNHFINQIQRQNLSNKVQISTNLLNGNEFQFNENKQIFQIFKINDNNNNNTQETNELVIHNKFYLNDKQLDQQKNIDHADYSANKQYEEIFETDKISSLKQSEKEKMLALEKLNKTLKYISESSQDMKKNLSLNSQGDIIQNIQNKDIKQQKNHSLQPSKNTPQNLFETNQIDKKQTQTQSINQQLKFNNNHSITKNIKSQRENQIYSSLSERKVSLESIFNKDMNAGKSIQSINQNTFSVQIQRCSTAQQSLKRNILPLNNFKLVDNQFQTKNSSQNNKNNLFNKQQMNNKPKSNSISSQSCSQRVTKQKMSCDDASIPMNIVSQYNLNENVSLPRENFPYFTLNPYNIQLSQNTNVIAVQKLQQLQNSKFISEESFKSQRFHGLSPNHSLNCFQHSSIQQNNQQQEIPNNLLQQQSLPFQNSTILNKMAITRSGNFSDTGQDNFVTNNNNQNQQSSQLIQKQKNKSIINISQSKSNLKEFQKLLLQQSNDKDNLVPNSPHQKKLILSNTTKAAQILSYLKLHTQKQQLIKKQLEKEQQQFEMNIQQKLQEDDENNLYNFKQVSSQNKMNEIKNNIINPPHKENKQTLVKVLKGYKAKDINNNNLTSSSDSFEQDDCQNTIQPKNLTQSCNQYEQNNKNSFQYNNINISQCQYNQKKQYQPKLQHQKRNKTTLVNSYFSTQTLFNNYQEDLNIRNSLKSLMSHTEVKKESPLISTSRKFSIKTNSTDNNQVSSDINYQKFQSNLQLSQKFKLSSPLLSSNITPSTLKPEKKIQTVITFKSNSPQLQAMNSSVFGQSRIIELLSNIQIQKNQNSVQNSNNISIDKENNVEDDASQKESLQNSQNRVYEKITYQPRALETDQITPIEKNNDVNENEQQKGQNIAYKRKYQQKQKNSQKEQKQIYEIM